MGRTKQGSCELCGKGSCAVVFFYTCAVGQVVCIKYECREGSGVVLYRDAVTVEWYLGKSYWQVTLVGLQ